MRSDYFPPEAARALFDQNGLPVNNGAMRSIITVA
jgi:hypothetical protein